MSATRTKTPRIPADLRQQIAPILAAEIARLRALSEQQDQTSDDAKAAS